MPNGIFGPDMGGDDASGLLETFDANGDTTQVQDDPNTADKGQPEQQAQQGQPAHGPATAQTQGQSQQADDVIDPTFGGQFKDPIALAKSYRELQRLQGQQSQEVGQLRQQVAQAAQLIQGMQQQYNALVTAIQSGQLPQAAPMPNAQGTAQQEPVDTEEWLNQFYEDPVGAIRSLVRGELDTEGRELGAALTQVIAPLQQYVTKEVTSRELARRYKKAEKAIPDFEDLRLDAAEVIEQFPYLAMQPDGLERAFEIARGRRAGQNQQQQPPQQQMPQVGAPQPQQQQAQARRAAARIPGSSGSRPGQQTTYDDAVRQSIFGASGSSSGVFG